MRKVFNTASGPSVVSGVWVPVLEATGMRELFTVSLVGVILEVGEYGTFWSNYMTLTSEEEAM